MMFGCVGLFIFLSENLLVGRIPHSQAVIVEFVDILCSLGACNLIAIASMLLVTRRFSRKMWVGLNKREVQNEDLEQELNQGSMLKGIGPAEFQLMASHFGFCHHIPKAQYHEYLSECLAMNACELMDVPWYGWVVIMVVCVAFLFFDIVRKEQPQDSTYLLVFAVLNWVSFLAWAGIWSTIQYLRALLRTHLVKAPREPSEGETWEGQVPPWMCKPQWGDRLEFGMQMLTLLNSLLISFYAMLLYHNLRVAGFDYRADLWMLSPLLMSLVGWLPTCITSYTVIQAYCVPNDCILDDILQHLHQFEDDMQYVRRIWKSGLEDSIRGFGAQGIDEEGLRNVFEKARLPISADRLHRIFKELDEDQSGTVDVDELLMNISVNGDESKTKDHDRTPEQVGSP
jgi:hypothetical protein